MVLIPRFGFLFHCIAENEFRQGITKNLFYKYYNRIKSLSLLLLTQTMKRDMWYSTLKSIGTEVGYTSEGCPSWSPPSSHTLPYTVSAHFPMDHRIEMRLMAVFFFSGKSLPFFRREASNELPLRETNIFVFFLTRIGFVCSQNVKKDKCGVKFLFKLSIALRCGI